MIATLYKIELLKMVKRLATWVTFLCFMVPVVFLFGPSFYNARTYESSYFGFPDALPAILVRAAPVVSIFSVALIVLLVSSEFDWRTSRQNIIDGLSRNQWFGSKLLVLPTVALLFYGAQLVFAAVLAWLGTDPGREGAYALSSSHWAALGGVFLGVLCYSSIALLVSILVRSTGPALGIALIYQLFENVVTRTLRGFELDAIADWFPFQVHNALFKFDNYLPSSSRTSRAELDWPTDALIVTGIAWVIAFLLVAYFVYRKRDL
jgi:ABC-2 type transport system permease protein